MRNSYILSYVNVGKETFAYDKSFKSLIDLITFVSREYPLYSSYAIVVISHEHARKTPSGSVSEPEISPK